MEYPQWAYEVGEQLRRHGSDVCMKFVQRAQQIKPRIYKIREVKDLDDQYYPWKFTTIAGATGRACCWYEALLRVEAAYTGDKLDQYGVIWTR